MYRIILVFCLYTGILFSNKSSIAVYGQLIPIDLESYFELNHDAEGRLVYADQLESVFVDRIDINKAGFEDLHSFGLLTDREINNILDYRNALGQFLDFYELQAVPGLNIEKIQALKSYVFVNLKTMNPSFQGTLEDNFHHNIIIRWKQVLENQKGFFATDSIPARYSGDPNAFRVKWTSHYKNLWKFSWLADKDAGELFQFGNKTYGFDHHSWSFIYTPHSGPVKSVIIGDFKAGFGQGLIQEGSYFSGKSAEVMHFSQAVNSVKSISTASEFSVNKGIAANIKIKNLNISPYFSFNKFDSSLDTITESTGSSRIYTASLVKSGYHRTLSELNNRSNQRILNGGLILTRYFNSWMLGTCLRYTGLEYPYSFSDKIYQSKRPETRHMWHVSISHRYRTGPMMVTGELAIGNGRKLAIVESIQLGLCKELDLAILFRSYLPGFLVENTAPFGETTGTENEQALYVAIKFMPTVNWEIQAFIDSWKHPWLRYNTDSPSNGFEYLFKVQYKIKRRWETYFLFKRKVKELNDGRNLDQYESGMNHIMTQTTSLYRINSKLKVNGALELRFRLEWKHLHQTSQSGYLLFADFLYKPKMKRTSMTMRYAVYDSNVHATSLYAFENDLLYHYSIPVYSNTGSRFYCNIRYKLNKNISLEFHYGRSFLPFEHSVSSGNDEIEENHKTTLKAQAVIKL